MITVEVVLTKEEVLDVLTEHVLKHRMPVALGTDARVLLEKPKTILREGPEDWYIEYEDGMEFVLRWEGEDDIIQADNTASDEMFPEDE